MEARKTYLAVASDYERFESGKGGAWSVIVTIPELEGRPAEVPTQARRLEEVEPMARDLVALMLDVPADSFNIEVHWEVPDDLRRQIAEYDRLRREAAQADRLAALAACELAHILVDDCGMTVRDAGSLMTLSRARVHQLTREPRDPLAEAAREHLEDFVGGPFAAATPASEPL